MLHSCVTISLTKSVHRQRDITCALAKALKAPFAALRTTSEVSWTTFCHDDTQEASRGDDGNILTAVAGNQYPCSLGTIQMNRFGEMKHISGEGVGQIFKKGGGTGALYSHIQVSVNRQAQVNKQVAGLDFKR